VPPGTTVVASTVLSMRTVGLRFVVHVLVFSFMSGIIHTYYVVAMAPAIGALVGGGLVELWRARERSAAGGVLLGAAIAGSAVVAWLLLQRTVGFAPGLGVAVRRLHDIGRSGWWILVGIIPLVGWIVLLVWYLTPGTPGSNEYGAAPA